VKKRTTREDGPDPAVHREPEVNVSPLRRAFSEVLLGGAARVVTLVALFLICFSAIFLLNAWQLGPKVLLERAEYRKFTDHVDARVVESWIALEIDVSSITNSEFWRASAKASPCALVEYGGEWGAPIRRAFCGNRLDFGTSYRLHGRLTMAPDVPFVWARDEHGFVVPEIRLHPAALQWLSTHPANTFMHRQWPAKTALEWLRIEEDRPVEAAVVGWSAKAALLPLAYDPQKPAEALPAGIVASRQQHDIVWFAVAIFAAIGLPVWLVGINMLPLLSGLAPLLRMIVGVLLLGTVPWWTQYFPSAVTRFSSDAGGVVADMFSDMNRLDRMIASAPSEAALVDGSRLTWRMRDSVFADTLGRYRLAPPMPAPATEDAALATLAAVVAEQTASMSDAERTALFNRLERDKLNDLRAVGIVFVPAARDALMNPQTQLEVRRAARRFLTAWVTLPNEEVDKYTPGYREWYRIEGTLADVPVPEIANTVASRAVPAEAATKAK
jgi:hypothetical protein